MCYFERRMNTLGECVQEAWLIQQREPLAVLLSTFRDQENLIACRSIQNLMESRREKYKRAADIVIDTTGKEIEEICEELLQKLSALRK